MGLTMLLEAANTQMGLKVRGLMVVSFMRLLEHVPPPIFRV